MKKPVISIITVVYNGVATLEQTILSVIDQTYQNIEYIIIDGGSTDGTIDVIKRYENKIKYWISEPDKGIYDAMNKAINIAMGDWLLFINEGDMLLSIPIQDLMEADDYDAVCGNVQTDYGIVYPTYSWKIKLSNTLPHQGLFYRKETMHSLYNIISYKIFSDYDYNLKMYKIGQKILISDAIVAKHSLDGVSNDAKYIKELYLVISNNCGLFFVILSFFRFKYIGLRKIINGILDIIYNKL